MNVSLYTGLSVIVALCTATIVSAQTKNENPSSPGFAGTLTEATELARAENMNFFIVVWEDDQNPTYQNILSLLSDSTVLDAFDGKILSLLAHKNSDNGLNLEKQFGFSEFPTSMFVSIEGEELYTLEQAHKIQPDQLIDLYERYVIP